MKLKIWAEVIVWIIYFISFIAIMFIDINALVCLLGIIGCTLSMLVLSEYGRFIDAIERICKTF